MNVKAHVTVKFPKGRIVAGLRRSAAAGINAAAVSMERTMRQVTRQLPAWGSRPWGPPGKNTGELHYSMQVFPRATPLSLNATVGSSKLHAVYMERGVRRKSKYLTVPMSKRAAMMLRTSGSVLTIPGLTWRPTRTGGGMLGLGGKKRTKFVPMFALKDEVRPRPWSMISQRVGMGTALTVAQEEYKLRWSGEARLIAAEAIR